MPTSTPRRGWSTSTTSAGCTWRWGRSPTRRPPRCWSAPAWAGFQDADTAFLDAAALRAAAEPRATARRTGPTRWDAMVAAARSKGWLSDDGASLQVHVESAAGA